MPLGPLLRATAVSLSLCGIAAAGPAAAQERLREPNAPSHATALVVAVESEGITHGFPEPIRPPRAVRGGLVLSSGSAYLRLDPAQGAVHVGSEHFSARLSSRMAPRRYEEDGPWMRRKRGGLAAWVGDRTFTLSCGLAL